MGNKEEPARVHMIYRVRDVEGSVWPVFPARPERSGARSSPARSAAEGHARMASINLGSGRYRLGGRCNLPVFAHEPEFHP
ncbi:hypothetical protein MishRS11D_46360 (plasmid) [Methylomagnum ishizawai]|nr:hypothetical protein MishRS11D_46360 [Methylomagnum ishizawai]